MKKNFTIGAIVVSYNGINHLENCVTALKNQSFKVTEILVINNGSTDGSKEYLEAMDGISVIHQENLGSSGGQVAGMKYFYKKQYDYIWCLDNDIIPNGDALEKLLLWAEEINYDFGFLSSCMLDKEGKIAWANIPELEKPLDLLTAILNNKPLPIISASFGSLLIPTKILDKVGLPYKEFFIWGDDAEFTLRMIKNGFKGYLVMNSRAIHNQENYCENTIPYLEYNSKKLTLGLRNITYVNIFRNEIVYNSKIRGFLSAFMYVIRILKTRYKKNSKYDWPYINNVVIAFLKGIFFKPKIEFIKIPQ